MFGTRWKRWQTVAALYAVCTLYLLFQGGKTAFMLFCILNVLLVYLILGRFSGIGRVEGSRKLIHPGKHAHDYRFSAGTPLEVRLTVRIPGFYPIPYVLVRDRLIRHDGQTIPFESSFVPNWRRIGEASYLTPPLRRGLYRFEETECSTRDIFGLFEHKGRIDTSMSFSVLPQTIPLRGWQQLQRGMRGPYSHASAPRSAKETTQINGVREYLYGDRLSRIHWNATAKTGEWKSKAFEREALPRTVIVLDRDESLYAGGNAERFELAVSVAASLVEFGLRSETAMGLLSVGKRTVSFPPRSGADNRNLMMKHLTSVDPDCPVALSEALKFGDARLEPGSLAVLVTAKEGEEALLAMQLLSRQGLSPCLIALRSDSRGAGQSEWLRVIRGKGWPVFSVRQLQDLPSSLEGGVA
ncbi:DUF58 domain-containing protein [Paenibacillus cisolokensis]|uniref:DUF58 domain-containing protein n=1 Tax=Paenibacillus cisolokensis TaxID=1658519 RepID=UPI003D274678